MFALLKHLASLALNSDKITEPEQQPYTFKSHSPAKITHRGTVTNINAVEEYGLVDKAIYFSFSVIYAKAELKVGDFVLVHANQLEAQCGWMASYVERVHGSSGKVIVQKKPPDKNTNYSNNILSPEVTMEASIDSTDTLEQIVSEFNGQFGKLKDGLTFSMEDCETEFVPVVGDVLVATIQQTNCSRDVVSWRPKDVRTVTGRITVWENNCGIVDDNVIFFNHSCVKKVAAFVGQKVSASVTTSEQGLFKWRAFRLSAADSDGENFNEAPCKPFKSYVDGIIITDPLCFGDVFLGKENGVTVILENCQQIDLTCLNCRFQNSNRIFYIGKNLLPLQVISQNSNVSLTIHCKAEAIGLHEDYLLFEFADYIIKRMVNVTVIDPIQHILKPVAPFQRVNKNKQTQLDNEDLVVIPGQKPFKPPSQFSNKLPPCPLPKHLLKAVQNREDLRYVCSWLFDNLRMKNYVKKFGTLIHLEEIQVRFDMKKFDISEAVLRRKGQFLSLEVNGLNEGRPSLIIGDKAILVAPHQNSSFCFEGYIHEIHLNEVLLKFIDTFQNNYDSECFDVRFELSRTNFRRLHQCVHRVAENHEYAIFPSKLVLQEPLVDLNLPETMLPHNPKRQKRNRSLTWKNPLLNWKQKEAVRRILECRSRPLPYIIFGPPGTGKTITLVEAVLQVYETLQESRIIICTPSNSAADLVAERIISSDLVSQTDLVRLNSYQRCIDSIPEFVKPYCKDKDALEHITQYRIIISTCSTAGSLYTIGLCNDFFTHVFIDEAGQLMEPESNIALGFIDFRTEGQLVMAGDPQQLGPVLRSSLAQTYGLQVSYMERLMSLPLYGRNKKKFPEHGGYNPLLITMLEDSYRSHPDILRFPSQTFYFSQIVSRFSVKEPTDWGDLLPHPGFPVIFHGVVGEEMREQNSPSWFNPAEVVQVVMYLQKLYGRGLNSSEVGIIAPYKKQVEKIRLMMSTLQLESCKLGSVEEFQGQERKVIIISTVRSSDQFINCDILYNLGFMSNPKRLNVAITRSQELLIVVGNPSILSKDFYWHSFVRYCVENGCYEGCELPMQFMQCRQSSAEDVPNNNNVLQKSQFSDDGVINNGNAVHAM